MPSASVPALRASVTDDLEALATPWRELETRHVGRSLYASHGFVSAAWQHLRADTDRLWIVRVDDDAGRLQGVLPLWLREERRFGLRLKVLLHPGILEGERPTLLAGVEPDRVWAAVSAELLARRREWHRLELRETDVGTFPWTAARSLSARHGWAVQDLPDHAAPYRVGGRVSAVTVGADAGGAPFTLQVLTAPDDMAPGWARYEALEARMLAGEGAPACAGTAQACEGAGALYRQWLPELARTGRVQLAFAVDEQGRDVAAWLRLLEPCGAMPDPVPEAPSGAGSASRRQEGGAMTGARRDGGGAAWLERHGAWQPGPHGPSTLCRLWGALQSAPWTDPAAESQCVHWPVPAQPALSGTFGATGHDRVRETRRLLVWNLRSRVGPLLAAQRLVRRIQGRG